VCALVERVHWFVIFESGRDDTGLPNRRPEVQRDRGCWCRPATVLAGSLGRAEEIAAEFPCLTTEFAVAMIIQTRW
jgi:hypothetical protein